MIAIFIGIVTTIIALLHLVVYKTVVFVFDISSFKLLLSLRIIFVILSLSFISASILANYNNNIFSNSVYTLASIWLGIVVYLFYASIIYVVLRSILSSFYANQNYSIVGIIIFVFALAVSFYGIYHAQDIKVKEYEVSLPNLPESWRGKSAVWLSDLHLGQVRGNSFAQKVADIIISLKPEIVFIGGDLYDGVKVNERGVISSFKNVIPPKGIYFITGNHEEFRDNSGYIDAVKSAGINVLDNKMVDIGGIQLLGFNDRDSSIKSAHEQSFNNFKIDTKKPSILLKHQPTFLDIAEKKGISFQISGHTHRAQMFPHNFITSIVYKGYDYGLKEFGSMNVYTSSGVGTWGPPMRVGTDAEIVKFTFR